MNSIESILGMVRTEAIMYGGMTGKQWRQEGCPIIQRDYSPEEENLPPIRYNLELVLGDDGKFYWAE